MLSKYDILLFDSDNTLYDHGIHEKTAIFEAFSKPSIDTVWYNPVFCEHPESICPT